MAAATSWRLVGVEYASLLRLSSVELLSDGQRVDAGAVITSSVPPSSGSLAALADGDAETFCEFSDAGASGFWIRWDLSSAADVTGIAASGSLIAATLQCLVGGRWLTAFRFVQGKAIDRRYVYMTQRAGHRWQPAGLWAVGSGAIFQCSLATGRTMGQA